MSSVSSQPPAFQPATPITARSVALWLWRELRIGVPICVATAVFLSLVLSDPLPRLLVYSTCIGLSIQFSGELMRHGLARWLHARGPTEALHGPRWPGCGWMLPVVVVATLGGYGFGMSLADALLGRVRSDGVFSGGRALVLVLVVCLAVALGAVYFFHSRARLALLREAAQRATQSAAEAQLRLLQSQLEPHMLFNTLANLRVLIASDPARAQAMLDRLIAFLRATLAASQRPDHTLADEFDRLADYLALMAVRMGERLELTLDLPETLRGARVPTLLLQPLVENSIRHGLEPQVHGGRIVVRARAQGDMLTLSVRDTGVGLPAGAASGDSGFGLQQVRERLAVACGERARLTLEPAGDADGGTLAIVQLPLADR